MRISITERIIFQLLPLIFLCSLTSVAQKPTSERIAEFVAPVGASGQFSGVVLVSENGSVIYEKAFGFANAEFKVPNTLQTRIGIASITKPMTSVILMRLLEAK